MDGVLKLIDLEIEGVRSFQDNQTINFKNRDKLIQIDGLNKDSGGSSGAGKSSIAIAIDYLFGTSSLAGTVLKPWDQNKTPKIVGHFSRNGIEITISRSTKDGLSIKVGDETTSGNSKIAEEKLDEVIGLPRDIFKRLIQKRQDDGSFFVSMTPKDKYDFLIKVLNLEDKNVDLKFIDEEVKEKTKELELKTPSIDLNTTTIAEFKALRDSKIEPLCSVNQKDIEALKTSIQSLDDSLLKSRAAKQRKIEELNKPKKVSAVHSSSNLPELIEKQKKTKEAISSVRKRHLDELNTIRHAHKDNEYAISNLKHTQDKANNIGSNIKALSEEKNTIEHNAKCNTCLQEWKGDTALAKIEEIKAKIASLIKEAMDLKKILDTGEELKGISVRLLVSIARFEKIDPTEPLDKQLEVIERDISIERSKQSDIEKTLENSFLKEESSYLKTINSIEEEFQVEIEGNSKQINSLKEEKMSLEGQLLRYIDLSRSYKKEQSDLFEMIKVKEDILVELKKEVNELDLHIQIAKESSRCLKSFILNTFQDTLSSIGESATEILNGIPNVATTSVFFEGFKENKSGGIKNEITAILSKSGYPDVPVKAMCGGESCAIGLAIDLAVIDIIETKAGKGTDFFVMDEPFNGLDAVCREDCLEIIKNIDSNKKIIVIDHCSELKEMVSDVITVVKENDISTIK